MAVLVAPDDDPYTYDRTHVVVPTAVGMTAYPRVYPILIAPENSSDYQHPTGRAYA